MSWAAAVVSTAKIERCAPAGIAVGGVGGERLLRGRRVLQARGELRRRRGDERGEVAARSRRTGGETDLRGQPGGERRQEELAAVDRAADGRAARSA